MLMKVIRHSPSWKNAGPFAGTVLQNMNVQYTRIELHVLLDKVGGTVLQL